MDKRSKERRIGVRKRTKRKERVRMKEIPNTIKRRKKEEV